MLCIRVRAISSRKRILGNIILKCLSYREHASLKNKCSSGNVRIQKAICTRFQFTFGIMVAAKAQNQYD